MNESPSLPILRSEWLEAALVCFLEAYESAEQICCDRWELALDRSELHAAGVSATGPRVLVRLGYAEHATETTRSRMDERTFQPGKNLAFTQKTCFVFTAAGSQFARAHLCDRAARAGPKEVPAAEPIPPRLPHWDAEHRELRVGLDRREAL